MERYNIVIVEDHNLIIDSYEKAFTLIENESESSLFTISAYTSLVSAYKELQEKEGHSKGEEPDLIVLDINMEPCPEEKLFSGEDLGSYVRGHFNNCKIIVATYISDNMRIGNILKNLNPEGFLVKSDVTFENIVDTFRLVLDNQVSLSTSVQLLLKQKAVNESLLDKYDVEILFEISHGARMKEILESIPLSKTSIEKRKKRMKYLFGIKTDSDKELVLEAKNRGFL